MNINIITLEKNLNVLSLANILQYPFLWIILKNYSELLKMPKINRVPEY